MTEPTIIAALMFMTLTTGLLIGWLASERYLAFLELVEKNRHEYEDLFEENPHPEIFNKDGQINRGDYTAIVFEPGFDPDKYEPGDIELIDDDE